MKKPSTKTTNPFSISDSFEVPAKWGLNVDSEGNPMPTLYDIGPHTRVYKRIEVDRLKRTLSRTAVSLFDHVAYLLRPNQDFVTLIPSEVCEELGIKPRTFRDARSEINFLITRRDSRTNTYWVNPAIMYNGNRSTQFPGHVKSVNTKPKVSTKSPQNLPNGGK